MSEYGERRTPPPEVAEILTRHRERAGFSQGVLAEKVGISVSMVHKLEHGTRKPSPVMVSRLGSVLNSTFEKEMMSVLMGRV